MRGAVPIGFDHGADQGLRNRDRVRHRRPWRREQPGVGLVDADQRLRRGDRPRAGPDRLGLRRRAAGQRRPRVLPRRRAGPRDRDDARQRRADQRCPLLRRPRPPRDLDARGDDRPRGGACGTAPPTRSSGRRWRTPELLDRRRRDRRLQEQLRRQGQQLRLPRELPDRPRDARSGGIATPDHPALRHPAGLLRRRQGRLRAARPARRRRAVPAQPAGRLLRGGDRPRDHAEASDRQHPRRAARRPPEVPTAARDRRRRQHERGGHVPQGRHDRDRAGDDRGRRARRRLAARQPGRGDPPGQPRPDAAPARSCCATGRGRPRSRSSGACSSGPASTSRRHGLDCVGETVGADVLPRWEAVLAGLESDPTRSPTGSTGSPSGAWSTATRERHGVGARFAAAEGDRPAVPRPASRRGACARRVGLDTLVDARRGRRRR